MRSPHAWPSLGWAQEYLRTAAAELASWPAAICLLWFIEPGGRLCARTKSGLGTSAFRRLPPAAHTQPTLKTAAPMTPSLVPLRHLLLAAIDCLAGHMQPRFLLLPAGNQWPAVPQAWLQRALLFASAGVLRPVPSCLHALLACALQVL